MRKLLFAVLMAAGIGLVGTSASAAPIAPIGSGLSTSNVLEAQYYGVHRRQHRRYHRRAYRHGYYGNRGYYGNSCTRVRVCDGYGYCRWRSRCY